MKFGKSLSNQVEQALPEWRDKFLSYKELKKRLKEVVQINGGESNIKRPRFDREYGGEMGEREGDVRTREEMDFVLLLEEEIKKLNDFFVEKEEEYIIRLKVLHSTSIFFDRVMVNNMFIYINGNVEYVWVTQYLDFDLVIMKWTC